MMQEQSSRLRIQCLVVAFGAFAMCACDQSNGGSSSDGEMLSMGDMGPVRISTDLGMAESADATSAPDMTALDTDGDGVPDDMDAFPEDPNETQDSDGDGVGDEADQFPRDPEESSDRDGDGIGDNGDAFPDDPNAAYDSDGDGIPDSTDQFPTDPNESIDTDLDGQGDNEDQDDDNDGLLDTEEAEFGSDCALSSPLLRDTDGDGIDDPDDPYPLDPHPEFMVRQSANGLVEIFLSERDGTFADPVEIGDPIEHQGRSLAYGLFSVGDFDHDGIMDFIAQSDPLVEGQPERNVYLFTRDVKADAFERTFLGVYDRKLYGVIADIDGDYRFDIISVEIDRPNNVTGARVVTYLNNPLGSPGCVAGESPEDGCVFVRLPDMDISATVGGQWVVRHAFQAVNLNPQNDQHLDLTVVSYASGGNAPSSVFVLDGRGDGTFEAPALRLTHNRTRQQAPANTVLFADFDNDGVGDVLMGFDDDGRAGESWTYFGMGDGDFFNMPVMALDLNPNDAREQGGGEFLGREGSGRTFDFDFDGNADLIIGYHHVNYRAAAQTRLYRGVGNGLFDPEFSVIGDESVHAARFAIPQRLCPQFSFGR